MFKTRESTPRYYTNTSRDFQLLGHLLDCVVANVRQGVEGISNLSLDKNIDDNLVNLTQTTLGLPLTKNYSSKSLLSICKEFKYILKLKGSQKAVKECVKTLLNAQNINDEYTVEFSSSDCYIEIRIPEATQDVELLANLLNYVIPAGFTYSVIKSKVENTAYNTKISESGVVTSTSYTSRKLSSYSEDDQFIKQYKYNITSKISEVGMTTTTSAKEFESNISTTSLEEASTSVSNDEE